MGATGEISGLAGCVLGLLRVPRTSVRGSDTGADPGPMPAREIASRLNVAPNTSVENQRREVRKLVAELRDAGHRVCECNTGYWLARDAEEWAGYLESVKACARYTFVRERQVREAVVDTMAGQGLLFETRDETACYTR